MGKNQLKDLNESDEEDEIFTDADTCSPAELETLFRIKYRIASETAAILSNNYILNLCSDQKFNLLVAGISDGDAQIFDINNYGLSRIHTIHVHDKADKNRIIGVRFLDETANNVLAGTESGIVRLFDLRTSKKVAQFNEASEGNVKPITCFDRNANSRILCAGTYKISEDTFLLFFDIRQKRLLGGFRECHSNDITSVCFHETKPDIICSGSVDGLINTFDISEAEEDDALLTTINTESTVQKLNWHKNENDKDILSCITTSDDLNMYNFQGDLITNYNRSKITNAIRRESEANCTLINCHNMQDGNIFLLTGSNLNKGKVMRSLFVQNNRLLPHANFIDNKQIVRDSVYDPQTNLMVTGGECGLITLWSPLCPVLASSYSSGLGKIQIKHNKNHKTSPY